MRHSKVIATICVFLSAGLLAGRAAGTVTCPTVCISTDGYPPFNICRSAAVLDTSLAGCTNNGLSCESHRARVDMVAGTTSISYSSGGTSGTGAVVADASDDYTLVGPGGPPLSVEVRALCQATVGYSGPELASGSQVYVNLVVGALPVNQLYVLLGGGTPHSADTFVSQSVSWAIGQTIRIRVQSIGSAGTGLNGLSLSGTSTTALLFPNLPPGYSVHSCYGYGQGVVPTARPSWGRLKVAYR